MAAIPVRATVTVPALRPYISDSTGVDEVEIYAPTIADAAVFLAAAAVTTGTVVIRNWDAIASSPSAPILRDALASMGTYVVRSAEGLTCTSRSTSGHLSGISLDLQGHPDLIAPMIVLAALADEPSELHGLAAHAQYAEQLLIELRGLGGLAEWDGATAVIHPQPLHGGLWDGAGVPAAAALGAVLALIVPNIRVGGLELDSDEGRAFLTAWRGALAADEHILPGATRGTVPFYR
jgi:3-phosphoshikimate 1-carboxyvinyltransferase